MSILKSLHTETLLSRFALIATTATALALGSSSAIAQQIDSAYTKIDLDICQQIDPMTFGDDSGQSGYWACVGYNNSLVFVAEGDLRFFVSYGDDALNEISKSQTLPAFNTINDTLEWRMENVNGNWVPFATILRYYTDSGDGDRGEVLVVTKLEAGNSCHVGYVDARLTPNANVAARNIADQFAKNFDCRSEDIHLVPS